MISFYAYARSWPGLIFSLAPALRSGSDMLLGLLLLLLPLLPQAAWAQVQGSSAALSTVLNSDGTLHPDARGSFDARGYQLNQGPHGQPVLRPTAQGWNAVGGVAPGLQKGVNGIIRAVAVAGNSVYVAGSFTTAGGLLANNVAKWDGTTWSSLGTGNNNGVSGETINALAVSGSTVYVGGAFTSAGGISVRYVAKWDGTTWSSLGSGATNGVNAPVYALAVSGTDVYVGGGFSSAGGLVANKVAKWDGAAWSSLGTGTDNGVAANGGTALALAVNGPDVYVGGNFTTAGAVGANNVAKWNGTTWSSLGTGTTNGVNNFVYTLAVSGTDVYAGGSFNAAGGVGANKVAKWNGTTWSSLGTGNNNGVAVSGGAASVYALAVNGPDVYVGGFITQAGAITVSNVAKWNGTTWSSPGTGVAPGTGGYLAKTARIYALTASGSGVYMGGDFFIVDGVVANHVAKWGGTSWSSLGIGDNNGTNDVVNAIAVSGTDVYVGGFFTAAGGTPANFVAKWNGTTWSSLGTGPTNGVNNWVYTLAVSGTDVYVGGRFTTAGGIAANGIAKWNGSAWSTLGAGLSDAGSFVEVDAMAMSGSDLYVGGHFTSAGGVSARNIAKWNGVAWGNLSSGVGGGAIFALAVSGTDVYVGGGITSADGIPVNYVAKWNGTNWSSLGTGLNNGVKGSFVFALAVSGTDVYVGGSFYSAGTVGAAGIAKWNGTVWSAMGTGIARANSTPPNVAALAVSDNSVYVGGGFATAGGIPVNNVARWDGTAWSSLGTSPNSGVNGFVASLAPSSSNVYVGGVFDLAGGTVVNQLANYQLTATPLSVDTETRMSASSPLALYPNPARGTAKLTGAEPGTAVQVFDVSGRLVLTPTASATGTVPLQLPSTVPPGIYLVRSGTRAIRLMLE